MRMPIRQKHNIDKSVEDRPIWNLLKPLCGKLVDLSKLKFHGSSFLGEDVTNMSRGKRTCRTSLLQGASQGCPQQSCVSGSWNLENDTDTRTNGQHYTAADRRPTNQKSAWQTERESHPTQFWSTYLNICENCNIFARLTPEFQQFVSFTAVFTISRTGHLHFTDQTKTSTVRHIIFSSNRSWRHEIRWDMSDGDVP